MLTFVLDRVYLNYLFNTSSIKDSLPLTLVNSISLFPQEIIFIYNSKAATIKILYLVQSSVEFQLRILPEGSQCKNGVDKKSND